MPSQPGMSLPVPCLAHNPPTALGPGYLRRLVKDGLCRGPIPSSLPLQITVLRQTRLKQTNKHPPPPKKNPQVVHLSSCSWRKAKPRELSHCLNEIAYTSHPTSTHPMSVWSRTGKVAVKQGRIAEAIVV